MPLKQVAVSGHCNHTKHIAFFNTNKPSIKASCCNNFLMQKESVNYRNQYSSKAEKIKSHADFDLPCPPPKKNFASGTRTSKKTFPFQCKWLKNKFLNNMYGKGHRYFLRISLRIELIYQHQCWLIYVRTHLQEPRLQHQTCMRWLDWAKGKAFFGRSNNANVQLHGSKWKISLLDRYVVKLTFFFSLKFSPIDLAGQSFFQHRHN